ncbi:MAG: rhomboid family intramembrane serine protease [Alphaproteobacteria bacterium]|jgi:membrane associated rhomboid family serine protease|nr:rhomboid family intramembrane serine protease [Alphaproteobacteria bacterium]MBN9592892.1 rhomboid family intramembrane serine protease [Alphaproteobacteria bacterium]
MAFLRESQGPRQPAIHAPSVVVWLIATFVLIYFALDYAPPSLQDGIIGNYAFYPARYSAAYLTSHAVAPGSLAGQAIPFISYVFLHADLGHLAINCLWLLAIGPVVARAWGTFSFLIFFFFCAVAAASAHLAFNWGSDAPVIGASGAISGLMGAAIRMLWATRRNGAGLQLAPLLSRPIVAFTLFWIGANVLAGLTGLGAGVEVRLIAWQAHIGGYLTGLLLAALFDRWSRPSGEVPHPS